MLSPSVLDTEEAVVDDVKIPRANEDSPGKDQETLQVLRPDGTLSESDEDVEARLAMESLMRHRRARRRKKLIAGGIVGAIVLVGAVAWGVSKFTGNAGGNDAPQLMTTFVDQSDFTEAVDASGAAKPVTSVVVNPEVGGTIESVNVAEGDTVQEGDVLLTVKNDELDKAIRDAEMGVRNAKLGVSQAQSTYDTTLDAYNKIDEIKDEEGNVIEYKRGAEGSDVDSAAFAVESARNSLSDAQEAYNIAVANAEKRTVRAPKSGSVVVMNAQVGASTDSAANAGGLIQIADLSQMTVKVQVNEVDISRVSVGQMAKATFSALPGVELDAQVTRIATVAGSGEDSHGYGGGIVTYDVSLLIPQPAAEFKPGMTANVQIIAAERARHPHGALELRGDGRDGRLLRHGRHRLRDGRRRAQVRDRQGIRPDDLRHRGRRRRGRRGPARPVLGAKRRRAHGRWPHGS